MLRELVKRIIEKADCVSISLNSVLEDLALPI